MKGTALITGIAGQDGSYLAELLLAKGYQVHGIVRPVPGAAARPPGAQIDHLHGQLVLHPVLLHSLADMTAVIRSVAPTECYHLAAHSFRGTLAGEELAALQTDIASIHNLLTAVRHAAPACRVYFASSSEMFGEVRSAPQAETTAFHPRSPYGIAKVAGFELVRYYRQTVGLYAASGILYNHESPRRGRAFVTRKIAIGASRIKQGLAKELILGDLDARRDWGHARDTVRSMWLTLQQPIPDDFVIATGEAHSVREFAEMAFGYLDLDYRRFVRSDPQYVKPPDTGLLVGDSGKARQTLGWAPSLSLPMIVREMVEADCALLARGAGQ